MDAGLRRELDATGRECAVGVLDEVELLGDVREEAGDLGAREVEEPGQRPSWIAVGSIQTLTRFVGSG